MKKVLHAQLFLAKLDVVIFPIFHKVCNTPRDFITIFFFKKKKKIELLFHICQNFSVTHCLEPSLQMTR